MCSPFARWPRLRSRRSRAASIGVVGADRAPVPERAQVLARIEAERRGVAERPGAAPVIARRAPGPRPRAEQACDSRARRARPCRTSGRTVDRQDRRRARSDRRARGIGIDQPGGGVDVAQHGRRAGVHDRQRRGDERVRRDDHLVAGPDPAARSVSDSAAVPEDTPTQCRLAVVGELRLELLDLGAEREGARPSRRPNASVNSSSICLCCWSSATKRTLFPRSRAAARCKISPFSDFRAK